jgi:hypothetical protein
MEPFEKWLRMEQRGSETYRPTLAVHVRSKKRLLPNFFAAQRVNDERGSAQDFMLKPP